MFDPKNYYLKMFVQGLTRIHNLLRTSLRILEPDMLPPLLKTDYVNLEMILTVSWQSLMILHFKRTPSSPPPVDEEVEDDEELKRDTE